LGPQLATHNNLPKTTYETELLQVQIAAK